jgi:hypothetical protein
LLRSVLLSKSSLLFAAPNKTHSSHTIIPSPYLPQASARKFFSKVNVEDVKDSRVFFASWRGKKVLRKWRQKLLDDLKVKMMTKQAIAIIAATKNTLVKAKHVKKRFEDRKRKRRDEEGDTKRKKTQREERVREEDLRIKEDGVLGGKKRGLGKSTAMHRKGLAKAIDLEDGVEGGEGSPDPSQEDESGRSSPGAASSESGYAKTHKTGPSDRRKRVSAKKKRVRG